MSTYYGVNATKRDVNVPSQKIPPGEVNGRVRVAYDEFTLTADLTTSDVIKMMKIPAGARVLDVHLAFDKLDASGGTIDVGWEANGVDEADPNGFINAADVATAADVVKMSDNLANGAGQFKEFSVETQVTVVPSADTDATSGSIKLAVYFVLD